MGVRQTDRQTDKQTDRQTDRGREGKRVAVWRISRSLTDRKMLT